MTEEEPEKECRDLSYFIIGGILGLLWSNPPSWTSVYTSIVQDIKKYVKTLPCLDIPTINSFKIVETDTSNIGYSGILKQKISPDSPEQIVRFHSGVWNKTQNNYSTIKKKILYIVL